MCFTVEALTLNCLASFWAASPRSGGHLSNPARNPPAAARGAEARLAKLLAKAPAGVPLHQHLDTATGSDLRVRLSARRPGDRLEAPRATRTGRPSKAWLKTKNPQAPGMLRFREEP
jgi:hypothetical protein